MELILKIIPWIILALFILILLGSCIRSLWLSCWSL